MENATTVMEVMSVLLVVVVMEAELDTRQIFWTRHPVSRHANFLPRHQLSDVKKCLDAVTHALPANTPHRGQAPPFLLAVDPPPPFGTGTNPFLFSVIDALTRLITLVPGTEL